MIRGKISSILLFVIVITTACKIQDTRGLELSDRTVTAEEYIRRIHDGYLLIRIPRLSKKEEALQKLINSDSKNPVTQARAKQRLEELYVEREEWFDLISKAMEVYDFSKWKIIPDDQYSNFLEGKRKGVFLSETGDLDENYDLTNMSFGVLTIDREFEEKNIIFVDDNNLPLLKPFPQRDRLFTIGTRFKNFFVAMFKNDSLAPDYNYHLKEINRKLKEYYREIN